MSEIDIKGDETLVALLLNADKNDIDLLIDYITPDGKFNFSQSDRVKKALRDGKNSEAIDEETLRSANSSKICWISRYRPAVC